LEYLAREHGYRLRTVRAAINVNHDQKTMLYKKASRRLITFDGLKIAVLGLTFKPGTDDLREAPSLYNIPLLLAQGAHIYAFDPVGIENTKKKFPEGKNEKGSITYVNNPETALKEANACFIFTEWDEICALEPIKYKLLMKTPLVYDGRNIYGLEDMYKAGVEYYSVGRAGVNISKAILGKTAVGR
ncbi:MAG: UDP-glucose/GDP-mannose dehydrogenase family protein, partial [Clostridium sp.]|nr:UDP-glucose/GDP-mannose dehydrogenase family protein [Clostridium sp.]